MGGYGVTNKKYWGSCQTAAPIDTEFGTHVQIHMGMNMPIDTHGGSLVFFRCQAFNSLGKLSNGCTDWHHIWYTSATSSGNGHRLNTICPTPRRHLGGGLGGSQIQVWERCQTAGSIGTKFSTRLWIHLGMDKG